MNAETFFVPQGDSFVLTSDAFEGNLQESARMLVEVTRIWRGEVDLFCRFLGKGESDETKWMLEFKFPSGCGRCGKAHKLLQKLFGSIEVFLALSFVRCVGDRGYEFAFQDLLAFAGLLQATSVQEETFGTKAKKEMERMREELMRSHQQKPQMLNAPYGRHVPYRLPAITGEVIREDIGVAAWVTVQQIDARLHDPQMRYKVHVLAKDDAAPRVVAEDHAYEQREGSARLTIVDLTADAVTIEGRKGQQTLPLKM